MPRTSPALPRLQFVDASRAPTARKFVTMNMTKDGAGRAMYWVSSGRATHVLNAPNEEGVFDDTWNVLRHENIRIVLAPHIRAALGVDND